MAAEVVGSDILLDEKIREFILEDLGLGDITTDSLIDGDRRTDVRAICPSIKLNILELNAYAGWQKISSGNSCFFFSIFSLGMNNPSKLKNI